MLDDLSAVCVFKTAFRELQNAGTFVSLCLTVPNRNVLVLMMLD